jgi:hypothetical protein
VLFWLFDSIYRSIQRIYINRYNQIERYLQSSKFTQAIEERSFKDFLVPNAGSGFAVAGKEKYMAIFQAGFMFHNFLLYAAMLILTLGVAVILI